LLRNFIERGFAAPKKHIPYQFTFLKNSQALALAKTRKSVTFEPFETAAQ
jgi:hypothetical protein